MLTRVAPRGTARVPVVVALVIVVLCALGAPAFATEAEGGAAPSEEGHSPTIDDIGTNNEVSNQYKPEPTELPSFMTIPVIVVTAVGILMGLVLLFMYLTWQPRFAEERRSRRRR